MADSNKWGMVVDIDRCTGCQGCVVACQAENNIPINLEEHFNQRRAIQWIRIERYWEGEYPNVKARLFLLCANTVEMLHVSLSVQYMPHTIMMRV